jgi:Spy/CpxP family protein refolding chaperone
MTRKNLQIAFYLLLVFASGSVVGALGYRTYNPPVARSSNGQPSPSEWRQRYIEETRSRLNLTADQVDKLKTMLDQTEERFGQEREHYNQMIQEIGEEHFTRVRMILTPEQVPQYEKLHQERVAKAKLERQQQKR